MILSTFIQVSFKASALPHFLKRQILFSQWNCQIKDLPQDIIITAYNFPVLQNVGYMDIANSCNVSTTKFNFKYNHESILRVHDFFH